MRRAIVLVGLGGVFLLTPSTTQGQSPAKLEFEVASVKPSVLSGSGVTAVEGRLEYGPDRFEAINYSLRSLIAEAYQLQPRYVTANDSVANSVLGRLYQVEAKTERPTAQQDMRMMLQNLLAERFKLTFHYESKLQPIYRLLVQKRGAKLTPSKATAGNARWVRTGGELLFRDATVTQFCTIILSAYMGRPVLDSTRITGLYNFPYFPDASTDEQGQSVVLSEVETLGLQLVSDKTNLEYLIVDQVDKASVN